MIAVSPTSKVKNLPALLGTALAIIACAVIVLSVVSVKTISEIEASWAQFERDASGKADILRVWRGALAPDGRLHKIRKITPGFDPETATDAPSNLRHLRASLTLYTTLGLNDRETTALGELTAAMEPTGQNLSAAGGLASQDTVDTAAGEPAKIKDSPGIRALDTLEAELSATRVLRRAEAHRSADKAKNRILYTATAVAILLAAASVVLFWFLGWQVDRLISTIAKAVTGAAEGTYPGPIPGMERQDDIGEIARAVETLRADAQKNNDTEEEFSQLAMSMELMNTVTTAANEASNEKKAFVFCLKQICLFTGWEIGHVYVPMRDGSDRLEPTDYWHFIDQKRHTLFKELTEQTLFARGEGLPGRAYEQAEPVWFSHMDPSDNFPRAKLAEDLGIIGGVAFPVGVHGEIVAVIEFYSTEPMEPEQQLIEILSHVCTQMGRVVERSRTDQEQKAHSSQLQEAVDLATAELNIKAEQLGGALEKEKQLNVLQRQFISMASHEFRTPLAIIDSTAQRLQRRADKLTPDEVHKRGEKIRSSIRRLTRLMESTLAVARIEEGKVAIDLGPCDIKNTVAEACLHQQEIATEHFISWDFNDVPESIWADPRVLEQVFGNLLSNAVKYTPNDSEISVTARSEGGEVVIVVRDQGPGIDEEDLPQMFDRFFRAKNSTGIAGTGIGLFIVKTFVEAHGGSVNVDSKMGKGTTFVVRLPISGPEPKLDDKNTDTIAA